MRGAGEANPSAERAVQANRSQNGASQHMNLARRAVLPSCAGAPHRGREIGMPSWLTQVSCGNPGHGSLTHLVAERLAQLAGVILGVITDPEVAADAHATGAGRTLRAVFNRAESTPFSEQFEAPATVLRLHHGVAVGRRGQLAGYRFDLGPSAALQIGGVTVVVISNRHQCHEPMFFEMFGIDMRRRARWR